MSTNPCSSISPSSRGKPSFGLKCWPISKSREPLHICLAGGKGMMENNDEISPWKSLEKAVEKFKGQSIEDVLRQQINKGEYFEGGGSGAKPPGGGGGGGGGGSPDGPGGSEDESFAEMFDENLQMIFATLGFIFLYIYILTGEEITKLARDYIKYLFGGNRSVRLKNAMYEMGLLYSSMTETEEVDEYWLEKAILDTPTWWHDPDYYEKLARDFTKSNSDESINADESFSNSDDSFF